MMMMTLMMIVKNALSGKFLRIIGLSANCLLDHMSFLAGDDDDDDDYEDIYLNDDGDDDDYKDIYLNDDDEEEDNDADNDSQ